MITTLNIYVLFIIIIIIIAIVYIQQKKAIKYTENFENDTDTEIETTQPQITNPQTTQAASRTASLASYDNINIQDNYTKTTVVQSLKDLEIALDRYSYLDAPIIVNDDGKICIEWGNYNNGKFQSNENKCIVPDNSNNVRKCVNINGGLTNCSSVYEDGYIERMNTLNIQPLIENAKSILLYNLGNSNLDLSNKNKELDKIINDIITKRNLETQQLYFINYNTNNLEDKQKNIDKINKNISDKQTEVNLNKVTFSQFLETNSSNEKLSNIYYKIIIGLIIVIIIVGILNILFSNIL
jgi:preprotein translocase subunit SecF